MKKLEDYNIEEWVTNAENDEELEFREAVHTILSAIASDPKLKASMIIKGGILLAVRYHSHRYTKDIDLSTDQTLKELDPNEIAEKLDSSLTLMIEQFDYDLDCKVQSCKLSPSNVPNATFPCINISVGYAYKGSAKHRRLIAKQCPTAITIDYSLNEQIPNVEKLELGRGEEMLAYSLTDLIAEKYRSLLQQVKRKRNRRQDIFDLNLILNSYSDFDDVEKQKILNSLVEKSHSREIEATIKSLEDEEIIKRAEKDYHTLEDEVEGELPDFNMSFNRILEFYKSLPWN